MKTIIIYSSYHHKNTEKIAKAIADILNAKLIKAKNANKSDIKNADLVGFGSGIYYGESHKNMLDFANSLEKIDNKKAFIFSTSGMKVDWFFNKNHKVIKRILKNKNFNIIGNFNCLGHDSYSLLKLIGGVNKKRPNKKDIKKAKDFAKNLKIK